MNIVMRSLREDHKYMLKLLYQLESEIKSLSGLSAKPADMDKLLEILGYIKTFPEISHHPIEEVMFEMLKGKVLGFNDYALVEKVIDEHVMLDALSELLEITLSEYLLDQARKTSLLRTSKMFLKQQVKHIQCEQNYIFPLCEAHLDEEDWQQLGVILSNSEASSEELQALKQIRQGLTAEHVLTS